MPVPPSPPPPSAPTDLAWPPCPPLPPTPHRPLLPAVEPDGIWPPPPNSYLAQLLPPPSLDLSGLNLAEPVPIVIYYPFHVLEQSQIPQPHLADDSRTRSNEARTQRATFVSRDTAVPRWDPDARELHAGR